MTTLVVGASGATGQRLVAQLLAREEHVRAIVRSPDSLPEALRKHERLSVIRASLLDLSDAELVQHVTGCRAVASCLGHNMSLKGFYGSPRRLVTEATRRLCAAIKTQHPDPPARFVLMNTTGNRNRDLDEPISFGQKLVIGLLRLLLPPHVDNEKASDVLRLELGQHDGDLQWVVVRPDGLTQEADVSPYELHRSPTRSAIFDAGKTSRINVAHFMATLITDDAAWKAWMGQMPVIYNSADPLNGTDGDPS